MTITNGYCTLTEVKNQINSKGLSTDTTDDGVIEILVNAASRHIDAKTSRRFYKNSNDETRYYQAFDSGLVFVDDLVSVTTLKTDNDNDRVYELTWATTDYDLTPANAALNGEPYLMVEIVSNASKRFPSQTKGVQIVGVFGWSAVPDDIKEACIQIVVNLYQSRRGVGSEGVATITGAGVVITPKDVSKFAADIIASHTAHRLY